MAAALASLGTGDARSQESEAPPYTLPPAVEVPELPARRSAAVAAAVATLLDPLDAADAAEAQRLLAGTGTAALPAIVGALDPTGGPSTAAAAASWHARAALMGAVAEMDAPEATPLLVAAANDPSYAVREAAVVGLGKTGDARAAAALIALSDAASEPVWRVRAALASALRRAALRGVMTRADAEAALARLVSDEDPDVRRAALHEIAPLAGDAALPTLLEIFDDSDAPWDDRRLALEALRSYRVATPALLDALRRAFIESSAIQEAVRAGDTLLLLRGRAALDDDGISAAVLRHLADKARDEMRTAIARLGPDVVPWLTDQTMYVAGRIAAGRADHQSSAFGDLLDTLVQVDEAAGIDLLRAVLTGPEAEALHRETRLAALRKVEYAFAPRMRQELRALFAGRAGADLRAEALSAIVASGGDDVAAVLDDALAHRERRVRRTALELLTQHSKLAAGPNLRAMARDTLDPDERAAALEALSRREPAEAAAIAASLLDHAAAQMREKAISILSASEESSHFDALLRRLESEEGQDVEPAAQPHEDPAPGATTPSSTEDAQGRTRRKLRRALLQALRVAGAEKAKPVLLRVARDDVDPTVREVAVRALRGIAGAEDAAALLALGETESDAAVRREALRTVATLGDAPAAVARFEALVADAESRGDALSLLREPIASVVPPSLVAGLVAEDWDDEQKESALIALDRAGRAPPAAELAAIARAAKTIELFAEAAQVLSGIDDDGATAALVALLREVDDRERLAQVVQAIGRRGAPEATPALLDLFTAARAPAFASRWSTDPAIELYRECAGALGLLRTQDAGRALAAHLLDAQLARAAARHSVAENGPFHPVESAPVTLVRALVSALAHFDEASCSALIGAQVSALAEDGRDLRIDEGYLEGVARYLSQPMAHDLPARRRPAAASVLFRAVTRNAPRHTALDMSAWFAISTQRYEEGAYREALAAQVAHVGLADVEHAMRPENERLWERGRIGMLEARALAAEGRAAQALERARSIRESDPSSRDLAYWQGVALSRLPGTQREALETFRAALAQDASDASTQLQTAMMLDATDGPGAALPHLEEALRLDKKRVSDAAGEYQRTRRGRAHAAAAYPYHLARALRALGRDDAAAARLHDAVALDDRAAGWARVDAAFAGWSDLEAVVQDALASIADS